MMTPAEIVSLYATLEEQVCLPHKDALALLWHAEEQQEELRLLTDSLAKTSQALADQEGCLQQTRSVLLELYNAMREYESSLGKQPDSIGACARLIKARQNAAAFFEESSDV